MEVQHGSGAEGEPELRVVETKLASNTDYLLVCQGLDYYIWALATGGFSIDQLVQQTGQRSRSTTSSAALPAAEFIGPTTGPRSCNLDSACSMAVSDRP